MLSRLKFGQNLTKIGSILCRVLEACGAYEDARRIHMYVMHEEMCARGIFLDFSIFMFLFLFPNVLS